MKRLQKSKNTFYKETKQVSTVFSRLTACTLVVITLIFGLHGKTKGEIITFIGKDPDGSLVNANAAFNDFSSAVPTLVTLDFESVTPGRYTTLSLPGVTLSSYPGTFDVFDGTAAGAFPVSGSHHIGNNLWERDEIDLTFDIPITSFGFYATDLDGEDVYVRFNNGTPQEFIIHDMGANGSDFFFGFVDTAASTTKVTIGDTSLLVTYDDISYIPEPATFLLLGLGGLSLMRRKRRG